MRASGRAPNFRNSTGVSSVSSSVELTRPPKTKPRQEVGQKAAFKAYKKPREQARDQKRSKIMVIEEVGSDEDDLVPYAKPDSDPEDETEDATMVDRTKIKTPV